eukprot:COSAG02_NODE_430_length_22462_cov_52.755042_16_plen_118_part_00
MSLLLVQGTIGCVIISAFEWYLGLCPSELRFKSCRACKMGAATQLRFLFHKLNYLYCSERSDCDLQMPTCTESYNVGCLDSNSCQLCKLRLPGISRSSLHSDSMRCKLKLMQILYSA